MPATSHSKPPYISAIWDRANPFPILSIVKCTIDTMTEPPYYLAYTIDFRDSAIPWLELDGENNNENYINLENPNVRPVLKDLTDLTENRKYLADIIFTLENESGTVATFNTTVSLTITGNPPNQIQADKSNYNLLYNRISNTLSGETNVTIVNNDDNELLDLVQLDNIFKPTTGIHSVVLEDNNELPLAINPNLPISGVKVVPCRLKKGDVFLTSFTATITVIDSEDIIATPSVFHFKIRNGYNEDQTAILNITNPVNKNFTITAPSWLTIGNSFGNSSAEIEVKTVNSDAINPGEYSGNIIIEYEGKEIIIPVYLTVSGFLDISTKDYNFCLDGVILSVKKMQENGRYARITMDMKFETASGIKNISSIYSIPFFKESAKSDIGEKVQNFFPMFEVPLFDSIGDFPNKFVYKPAVVNLTVDETDVNYEILHSAKIENLTLFAGNRPKKFPLFSNHGIRRKYNSGSKFIFSYYTGLLSPEDFLKESLPYNPSGPAEIQTVMVSEELIDENSIAQNMNLFFLPMKNQERQIVLQWQNNNLVPEWMILSGKYKINSEFEHTHDKIMINGKKYDSKEVMKITISTGFILKEEIKLLKEIIKSRINFMKIENEIYPCFCITQKLLEVDSDENWPERELEFFITSS